jgi:hypothetical protein
VQAKLTILTHELVLIMLVSKAKRENAQFVAQARKAMDEFLGQRVKSENDQPDKDYVEICRQSANRLPTLRRF